MRPQITAATVTAGFIIANDICPNICMIIVTTNPKFKLFNKASGSNAISTWAIQPKNTRKNVPMNSARTTQNL